MSDELYCLPELYDRKEKWGYGIWGSSWDGVEIDHDTDSGSGG